MDWSPEVNSNPDLGQHEVLTALQPPPKIKELIIRRYKGARSASWMDTSSLSRLELLQLDSCTSREELPPLWKLPCLNFLRLCKMKAIRSLGCHSSDRIDIQFPVLEELVFCDLLLWEEWNGVDDYIWFPHLKTFKISSCPKLKKIPNLPLSIETLNMQSLGLEALPRSYNYKCSNDSRTFGGFQLLMSLKSFEIYNCTGIVQIGSICEEDDHLLPSSLKELGLDNIDEHKDFASYQRANEMEHLTVLQDLNIDGAALTSLGAPKLKSLPRMPASLEELMISRCNAKLEKHFQKNIGPDWPNINHIPHINIKTVEEDKDEFKSIAIVSAAGFAVPHYHIYIIPSTGPALVIHQKVKLLSTGPGRIFVL
ncbi:hypothetical protein ZIOFF_025426 [Zingiber officinale]|uniref:R13L1/DRL21-like LRR repeat region domain-containing protein n=1 Tax=Zingiber officinale TaxID=94328 RepID=A0A8J5GU14_ZINOF|nr:hypothetical protein ZIOFF_025426 [Zingiber officinale]